MFEMCLSVYLDTDRCADTGLVLGVGTSTYY